MAKKPKDSAPLHKLNRALERSLLQEVMLFDIITQEGKFSHSEIINFCLN
ncbi:MAG: hypothetical protein ISR55_04215 [Bacteroidetes bacterium]|nr:hypothetical protein [Bacteroidota bacterium]